MSIAIGKKTELPSLQSLISGDYLSISEHETVGSTVERLREHKADFQDKFVYLYVIDEREKLVGVLRIRDLLIEDPRKPITGVMERLVVHILESASLEEVLKIFRAYSFFAFPVTDETHRLVGVIPRKRIQKFLSPVLHDSNPFDDLNQEEIERKSVREIVLKRLPWLLISVTSGLVCAYILGIFIGKVESIVAFILFVPIVLGLAGSVSTQSARITVRGLREEKLAVLKLVQILGKQIAIGLVIGSIAFLLACFIALLWRKSPLESIALGLAIVGAVTASSILGIILPIVFQALRFPSDFASGLFLLFVCDIVALILYFMISFSLVNPMLELG